MVITLLSLCCLVLLKTSYAGWKKARMYEAEHDALQLQYNKLERRFQGLSDAESLSKSAEPKRVMQVDGRVPARVA